MRAREERLRWRCASPSPTKLHPNCMLQMQCNAAGTHVRTRTPRLLLHANHACSAPKQNMGCGGAVKSFGEVKDHNMLLARSRSTATTCTHSCGLWSVGGRSNKKKNCKRLQVAGRACTATEDMLQTQPLSMRTHSFMPFGTTASNPSVRPSVSERESSHGRGRGPTRT